MNGLPQLLLFGAKRRVLTLLLLLCATLFFSFGLPRLEIDTGLDLLLNKNSDEYRNYQDAMDVFGSDETTIIFLKHPNLFSPDVLQVAQELVYELEVIESVERVDSLFTLTSVRDRDGMFENKAVIEFVPYDQPEADLMREDAVYSPLLLGNYVNKEANTMVVSVTLSKGKSVKVINKKFVINPYSSVLFNPPPIDDVKLEVLEVTEHLYQIGQGKGDSAGFSSGTVRGKVRFIRLKYDGGDWEQDMDRGSDLNLLTEYGVRTGHPVSDRPEPMEIGRLKSFPKRKSPPIVYMTGQEGISLSDTEIQTMRRYLLEHHGMLFGDNGGSSGWEGQFVSMMKKVLPRVETIDVYLDHPIHRIPYSLPRLPIVAPHGRSNALGWVVDGRLVAYYHPGDIGDAWADGHSGVKREVWESSYQLGVNIIYYAHTEYNKWLERTKK